MPSFYRRLGILLAAISLSACATGRPYIGGSLVAEDARYFEFNRATGEAVAAPRNPLGRATVGYELQPRRDVLLTLDVSHTSSLRTGSDRGVNAVTFAVRWYPFD